LIAGLLPGSALTKVVAATRSQQSRQSPAATDPLTAARAEFAMTPLEMMQLRDNIYMLYGPGGNMLVLTGADGKVLVDTGVAPVAAKVKAMLDGLGDTPLKLVINTHWHFDHTDNNAAFHAAGATILAHENTVMRMSEPHDYAPPFAMHIPASPAGALPQQTFKDKFQLDIDHEQLDLGYIRPAHTDTDIYIHYRTADVLHLGDVWFNGMYPYIDASTGGGIHGMIAASTRGLGLVGGDETIIVPGHGPVGDKGALAMYRDMLTEVSGRVQQLKSAGQSLVEAVAAQPTADFDPDWGGGRVTPDNFVTLVYTTL
jgi:cyclase